MSIRLYNTLTRQIEPLQTLEPGKVRMYVCGVTVYDRPHIGNARSAVAFDVIRRWLTCSGYAVQFVRNITDIDDKMIARAVQNGETVKALAERMTALMYQDYDALGVLRPSHDPRATDYLPQMKAIIQTLQERGLAYRTEEGDVNYAVRQFEGYGKLSGKPLDELQAGERVAVSSSKRDPLDFVLWKSAKAEEPQDAKWESPWGLGRPGWHIECSAMACAILGQHIDIHGGGIDLTFPHHENEIAQSEGAHGETFARYWMHNGFLNIDGEKMSKSLGNFFNVPDVLAHYDRETLRFFLVRGHYRSELGWSNVHLDDAQAGLRRLYTTLLNTPPNDTAAPVDWQEHHALRFKRAMDDDFGTPEAVAVLFELAAEVNRSKRTELAAQLRALAATLGLLQSEPQAYLQSGAGLDALEIQARIAQRAQAKASKNFALADSIRQDLLAQGVVLKDSATGTSWERK
jgi:cysteinyl-tRNA synthetase